jgi:dolichol-phosphate mannosyltransferase
MKSVLFIPVYNQIVEFPTVLRELRETNLPCDTVLLVNNGSSDGSEKLVAESGYEVINLLTNRGIGHSFMWAVDWALTRGYDVFSVIASNGKMLPSELSRVLDPVLSGEADYVTGSRYLDGGESPNLPVFRQLSIPMVGWMVKALFGATLTDATCGYKAFRLDLLRRAQFDWKAKSLDTYGFEYYLYGKILRDPSIRWKEVPITMRYPTKGKRYSKIKPFSGWYEMLKPWVIARFDGKGFAKEEAFHRQLIETSSEQSSGLITKGAK